MKTIRGGNGFGDSLYVQSVARYLVDRGERLEVCTSWPAVFRFLNVTIGQFRRNQIDIVAHYISRKEIRETTQFQDCCIQAGINDPVELRLDWSPVGSLYKSVLEFDKPIILVGLPRQPMNRKDGYGIELLPDCNVIQKAIQELKGKATLIQIGAGESLFKFDGLDLDLSNKTTVYDLLDIASVADGFLGYCSFLIPLAESFAKPLLTIWSQAGLKSPHRFIRLVRPHKLLHRTTSKFVMDNCPDQELTSAVHELLDKAGNGSALLRKIGGDCRERAGVAG